MHLLLYRCINVDVFYFYWSAKQGKGGPSRFTKLGAPLFLNQGDGGLIPFH